jgi:hypothetical protein
MKINQEYVVWWVLIVAVLIALFPVSSCVQNSVDEHTKRIQLMTQHCASQGKTFKAENTESSEGLCI